MKSKSKSHISYNIALGVLKKCNKKLHNTSIHYNALLTFLKLETTIKDATVSQLKIVFGELDLKMTHMSLKRNAFYLK